MNCYEKACNMREYEAFAEEDMSNHVCLLLVAYRSAMTRSDRCD